MANIKLLLFSSVLYLCSIMTQSIYASQDSLFYFYTPKDGILDIKQAIFSFVKGVSFIHVTREEYEEIEESWDFTDGQDMSDEQKVKLDADELVIGDAFVQNLRWDLLLDTIGKFGSSISWTSDNPTFISDKGKLLKYSSRMDGKEKVKLTATISAGSYTKTKSFLVSVAYEEPEYAGYLFAYFEGSGDELKQEHLRFGISTDAMNWHALNNNEPVILSDTISQTGGIRDPHILRGEDEKSFYLVATDMSAAKNGWHSSNPGIILMKSNNLTDWSHTAIDLVKTYPQKFGKAKWVWAPQTIFDPVANKYMVYFTVIFHDDQHLDFYCAYANSEFTGFETIPMLMFRPQYGGIDGDIIYKDGVFYFFYKGNIKDKNGVEIKSGILQAIGKRLQGPWKEDLNFLDAYADTQIPIEGSGVFKLNNSDSYILMYDLFRNQRYEFQRSTDLVNFTPNTESFVKNFTPRHGTVMSITKKEIECLKNKWGITL